LDQNLQFNYPYASIKDVQVIEEAFSSQKRPSNTSKHELLNFFFAFVGHFCPPGSGSTDPIESGSATLRKRKTKVVFTDLKIK
jgi:hypothetical protein